MINLELAINDEFFGIAEWDAALFGKAFGAVGDQ